MSPLGIIFRGLVILIAFLVAFALLAFAIKLLEGLFLIAAIVGCIAFAIYVYRKVFRRKTGEAAEEAGFGSVFIASKDGVVNVFHKEPGVSDLVAQGSAQQGGDSQLPSTNLTIEVPADLEVKVLEESDLALKIKIKAGSQKGKVGWVDKAHVKGYTSRQ